MFKSIVYFFIVLISFSLIACKGSENKSNDSNNGVNTAKSEKLPPVPEKFIYKLFQEVDHIDYFFRYTNFSVSQDEKEATQAFIGTLSPGEAGTVSDTCVSPLRLTFLSEGNILAETEMYMTQDCRYVEYYIDGKKMYHSSYSEPGYNFLLSIYRQAENAQRPN